MMCKHFKKKKMAENSTQLKVVTPTIPFKSLGSERIFLKKELMLLISKDTFN